MNIHSFSKYLMSTLCVLSTVFGFENMVVNKTKFGAFMKLFSSEHSYLYTCDKFSIKNESRIVGAKSTC